MLSSPLPELCDLVDETKTRSVYVAGIELKVIVD